MKKIIIAVLALVVSAGAFGQNTKEKDLNDFDRLVLSPHINLVLTQGDQEHIRMEYENVDLRDINVEVSGNTLRIFLENAKIIDKQERYDYSMSRSIYQDARITAYVTFKDLEYLEIRGDQQVTVESPIRADQFRMKIYGENDVRMKNIQTEYFKVIMYGENELNIDEGKVEYQKYTMYGENIVDVSRVRSLHATTKAYGESEISLHVEHELQVSALGEPIIMYSGNPKVNRGLIIGEAKIFDR
jgi:hypothetical protein